MARFKTLFIVGVLFMSLTVTGQQPPTRQLTVFGECWGFLKYFHPAVRSGRYDWDSVLMAKLPQFNKPLTKAALNGLIVQWIDETDALAVKDGLALVTESQPGLDCPLMTEEGLSEEVKVRVRKVLAYHRDIKNFYYDKKEELAFGSFSNEKRYDPAMFLPPAELRLLTLFRIWNTFYYYAPYSSLTDRPWADQLGKYIPAFWTTNDTLAYHLLVREFVCGLNDGHAVVLSAPIYYGLGGGQAAPFISTVFGDKLYVTQLINDSLCRLDGIKVGDVMLDIDGQTIAQKRDFYTKYIPWSNKMTLGINIGLYAFFHVRNSCVITRQTSSGPVSSTLHLYQSAQLGSYPPSGLRKMVYDVNDSVTYVNMEMLTPGGADSVMATLVDKKALIIDDRGYPNNTWAAVMKRLMPGKRPFALIGYPSSTRPGRFDQTVVKAYCGPDSNAYSFRGRMIILVNEGSQSHSEFTAMALQAFPGSYTIGRPTAGADGDIITLPLPGNMAARFSSLQIAYADGRPAQRIGVHVDQVVPLTEEDLLSGRDAILEAGIEKAVKP